LFNNSSRVIKENVHPDKALEEVGAGGDDGGLERRLGKEDFTVSYF
jgi:hypothetical protein